jgi:hypothetical protein
MRGSLSIADQKYFNRIYSKNFRIQLRRFCYIQIVGVVSFASDS